MAALSSGRTTTTCTVASGNGGVAALTAVTSRQDRLIVIDWIVFTGTTAAAETWTLEVSDGSGQILQARKNLGAGASDRIEMQFPTGLPLWTVGAGGFASNVPAASPLIGVSGQPGDTGQLTVGFHYEPPAMRMVNT